MPKNMKGEVLFCLENLLNTESLKLMSNSVTLDDIFFIGDFFYFKLNPGDDFGKMYGCSGMHFQGTRQYTGLALS